MASDTLSRLIDQHLPDLHRERWAQIDAELFIKLASATAVDRAAVENEIAAHQAIRHRPETSRDAIVEQAEANARRGQGRGR